jgi:hypothetical protein
MLFFVYLLAIGILLVYVCDSYLKNVHVLAGRTWPVSRNIIRKTTNWRMSVMTNIISARVCSTTRTSWRYCWLIRAVCRIWMSLKDMRKHSVKCFPFRSQQVLNSIQDDVVQLLRPNLCSLTLGLSYNEPSSREWTCSRLHWTSSLLITPKS